MPGIRFTPILLIFFILCGATESLWAQKGMNLDIKKPEEYEERTLRSERSDQKKFTLPRRFFQNTGTHFNYFFNANNKLNEVLERAKLRHKDDYSLLLPFYNYSLDATATDSIQLDSIIYKSSSGIALHDLRNDWVDNLYILWGASYHFQKKFDSAYLMFQFINYAFAPKEKDGYYRAIGSSRDGNQAYSIATKEKRSLPKRLLSEPPSRNEAFIWQIRNFLAQDLFAEAASLIVTLKQDPLFPKRLDNDLHEMQALWFYKQGLWDSAAVHLSQALGAAVNAQEKARWEYLAAQLYEKAGRYAEAEKFYRKVSSLTTDLVLDIYARLAAVRVNRNDGEKTLDKNVASLLRMAKQDKYADYRDIIYYMAAQMQLEGNRIPEALALLRKSTQYASNGDEIRNKAFLQLADMSLKQKNYRDAYSFYDSIKLNEPSLKNPEDIRNKKASLQVIAASLDIIERQDSMQRIARLPEEARRDFVRKLVRDLRKQQGLKDDGSSVSVSTPAPDAGLLFASPSQKGEWYFYNAAAKTRGLAEFKGRWGNRPNLDNWRRGAALAGMIQQQNMNQQAGKGTATDGGTGSPGDLSFESLYERLPLTEEQLKVSNDSLQEALFALGKAYIHNLEDCPAGTGTLEDLRNRFPGFPKMDEVLFNLFFCYRKEGDGSKAENLKKQLEKDYPGSSYTTIVTTGVNPAATTPASAATRAYEEIYDLFIEGRFTEARAAKRKADSSYGKSYWTPQLLYIEAVYYIRQREDSIARDILNNLITQFAGNPMVPKAGNLLRVLNRRAEIEEELGRLQVKRLPEDTVVTAPPVVKRPDPKPQPDTLHKTKPVVSQPARPVTDTGAAVKPVTPPAKQYSHQPNSAHYAVVLLNKVDPVFVNEARNAFARYNRETYFGKTFTQELSELDGDNRLLLVAPFAGAEEALAWVEKARPVAATEIVPWLRGGKFSFLILSENNLEVLKNAKDTEACRNFLNGIYPGKF